MPEQMRLTIHAEAAQESEKGISIPSVVLKALNLELKFPAKSPLYAYLKGMQVPTTGNPSEIKFRNPIDFSVEVRCEAKTCKLTNYLETHSHTETHRPPTPNK